MKASTPVRPKVARRVGEKDPFGFGWCPWLALGILSAALGSCGDSSRSHELALERAWTDEELEDLIAQDCDTSVVDRSGKVGHVQVVYVANPEEGTMHVQITPSRTMYLGHPALPNLKTLEAEERYDLYLTDFGQPNWTREDDSSLRLESSAGPSMEGTFAAHEELLVEAIPYKTYLTHGITGRSELWLDCNNAETALQIFPKVPGTEVDYELRDESNSVTRPGIRVVYDSDNGETLEAKVYAYGVTHYLSHPDLGILTLEPQANAPSAVITLASRGNVNPLHLTYVSAGGARSEATLSHWGANRAKTLNRVRLEHQDERSSVLWMILAGRSTAFLVADQSP